VVLAGQVWLVVVEVLLHLTLLLLLELQLGELEELDFLVLEQLPLQQ
jgi:hypothetical protein